MDEASDGRTGILDLSETDAAISLNTVMSLARSMTARNRRGLERPFAGAVEVQLPHPSRWTPQNGAFHPGLESTARMT